MHGLSIMDMWGQMSWVVKGNTIFMVIMSIWSLVVIIERWMTYSKGANQSYSYILALRDFLQQHNSAGALAAAQSHDKSPVARVMGSGLSAYQKGMEAFTTQGPADVGDFDVVDSVNRALERVKERETAGLRKGLGGLATIASVAPFVGLFGTVLGIINAFDLLKSGGGIEVIGPGIAEALVSTAFGLLVAIPAAMFFNFFTGKVETYVVDMNDVSSEFIDFVLREGRS